MHAPQDCQYHSCEGVVIQDGNAQSAACKTELGEKPLGTSERRVEHKARCGGPRACRRRSGGRGDVPPARLLAHENELANPRRRPLVLSDIRPYMPAFSPSHERTHPCASSVVVAMTALNVNRSLIIRGKGFNGEDWFNSYQGVNTGIAIPSAPGLFKNVAICSRNGIVEPPDS